MAGAASEAFGNIEIGEEAAEVLTSIAGANAKQSGEHNGKEGAAELYATSEMFAVLFGGACGEKRVDGGGGRGDVGGNERAGYRDVNGHRVGRAIKCPHDNVDLGALRGRRAKTAGGVDIGGNELSGQVGDEAN